MLNLGGMFRAARHFCADVARSDWCKRIVVSQGDESTRVHYVLGLDDDPPLHLVSVPDAFDVDELLKRWAQEDGP